MKPNTPFTLVTTAAHADESSAGSICFMDEELHADLLQCDSMATLESTHKALLESMSDGVFIANDGHFVFANAALPLLLGYAHHEFVGLAFAQVVAPEYLTQWQARMDPRTGLDDDQPESYRLRLLKKEHQTEVWVDVQVSRLGDAGQHSLLGIVRDVTERRRVEQRGHLRDHVLERLAMGAGLDSVLHSIVFATEEVVPQMCCGILTINPGSERLRSGAMPHVPQAVAQMLDGVVLAQAASQWGLASRVGCVADLRDVASLPASDFAALLVQQGLHSCWSMPIADAAGRLAGVLVAYGSSARGFSQGDVALLQQAADLAGLAMARKRSEEELQLASLVYQASTQGMMVLDGRSRILTINPACGSITGYSADEMMGADVRALPIVRDDPLAIRRLSDAMLEHGQWQGEVWSRRKSGEAMVCWVTINSSLDASGKVQRRVVLFSDITNRKQSEDLIWRQANFDMLTQLPNRNMLQDRLSQEVKRAGFEGRTLALLSIDLDKFKEVNDALGQEKGDQVLVEAARRIGQGVGAVNTVARMGGNEFVAVLPVQDDCAQVDSVVLRLLTLLAAPYQLGDDSVVVNASIGLAYCPDDAAEGETLLSHSAQAMQLAKANGGNQCCQFTAELQRANERRAQLLRDLRVAVAGQQFVLHFQPIIDLHSGQVHKAEALLRWNHPQHGLVSPAEFIPLAEETGLIVDIGNWVFQEATRWAKRWREQFDAQFQISINKSPRQFDRHGLVAKGWLQQLKAMDLPGNAIVIEITEGLLLNTESHVARTMQAYREAGVQLAIDDFGTGYSALSYLKKFSIDYLKIDQSFTRNLAEGSSDFALCEAMVVMAHRLGLKVIAEGLETDAQRQLMRGMACDCGQGYLVSRPVPAAQFEAFLGSQSQVRQALAA